MAVKRTTGALVTGLLVVVGCSTGDGTSGEEGSGGVAGGTVAGTVTEVPVPSVDPTGPTGSTGSTEPTATPPATEVPDEAAPPTAPATASTTPTTSTTTTTTTIVRSGGGSGASGVGGSDPWGSRARNPFRNPDPDFELFPEPSDPGLAPSVSAPRPGPWTVTNFAGQVDCGIVQTPIPQSPPEGGEIEVLDGGATLVGTGLGESGVSITLTAVRRIAGRYAGQIEAEEQGIPVTIDYFLQVVTDEHLVGYLTSTFSAEGVTCTVYRPYELVYSG